LLQLMEIQMLPLRFWWVRRFVCSCLLILSNKLLTGICFLLALIRFSFVFYGFKSRAEV
jgi:hypothetical protein